MTPAEVARLLQDVGRRWPRAVLPVDSGDTWLAELADVPADAAFAAVRDFDGGGEQFPPAPGRVRALAEVALQGPPPAFDEIQAWLSRHSRLLPYGNGTSNRPEDTPQALAAMQAAGAHEALLRFVAAHGVRAVRFMPDATLQPLDQNQLADRRDLTRDYRHRVLAGWEADPRPGLALERACRPLQLDPAKVLEIATATSRREIERTAERRALPPGQPEDDDPMVDVNPAEILAHYRRERAKVQAERTAALAETRRLEAEDRRAAERELAEHAARRGTAEGVA